MSNFSTDITIIGYGRFTPCKIQVKRCQFIIKNNKKYILYMYRILMLSRLICIKMKIFPIFILRIFYVYILVQTSQHFRSENSFIYNIIDILILISSNIETDNEHIGRLITNTVSVIGYYSN